MLKEKLKSWLGISNLEDKISKIEEIHEDQAQILEEKDAKLLR